MSLKDRITEDMKAAMRAKDAPRLLTIRGLLAACKQREVDERIVLDDAAVIGIVDKLVKQRKDSIAAVQRREPPGPGRQGSSRADGARGLPAGAPRRAEVDAAVTALVAELGAKGPADMGRVMAAAKARLGGTADMGVVSAAVKQALAR